MVHPVGVGKKEGRENLVEGGWLVRLKCFIKGRSRVLGIGLELACNGGLSAGVFSKANDIMILHCKLVPVQYRPVNCSHHLYS